MKNHEEVTYMVGGVEHEAMAEVYGYRWPWDLSLLENLEAKGDCEVRIVEGGDATDTEL